MNVWKSYHCASLVVLARACLFIPPTPLPAPLFSLFWTPSNPGHSGHTRAKTIQERLHSVKNNSKFEIAALFHHLYSEGKSAPMSKLELFLTEWNRSYIVLTLVSEYFVNSITDTPWMQYYRICTVAIIRKVVIVHFHKKIDLFNYYFYENMN